MRPVTPPPPPLPTPPTPTLRGAIVTLRPYSAGFSEDELRTLYSWARDDEVLALAGGLPLTLDFEHFQALFLSQLPRHNGPHEQLFVILDAAGDLVGRAGLYRLDPPLHRAELGIVIGERDRWAQGLGSRHRPDACSLRRRGPRPDAHRPVHLPQQRARPARLPSAGFRAVRTVRRFSLEMGAHDVLEMVWEAVANASH